MENCSNSLDLPQAQEKFVEIIRKLKNQDDIKQFLSWIQFNWLRDCNPKSEELDEKEDILKSIACDLRVLIPLDGILPSETIFTPNQKTIEEFNPSITVHVDSFLYDDETVDALCEEGKMSRNFCLNCGSHNTKPLSFISHSASRECCLYIFRVLLPPLHGKVVLDVGSRLGSILYGAYLYSNPEKIIGIEMNKDFCNLQNSIIHKYGFQNKIQVIADDIRKRPDVLQAADVVILNNVFEFFIETELQIPTWSFLRQHIKSGTLLVTMPPLENVFADLRMDVNFVDWVEMLPLYNEDAAGISEFSPEMNEVVCYKVK